jgi:hypothetical protein
MGFCIRKNSLNTSNQTNMKFKETSRKGESGKIQFKNFHNRPTTINTEMETIMTAI